MTMPNSIDVEAESDEPEGDVLLCGREPTL